MRFAGPPPAADAQYDAPAGSTSVAEDVARGSVRATTEKGYRSGWLGWVAYCGARLKPLADCVPGSEEMRQRELAVADFLALRHRGGLGPSGLKTLRAAIRKAHRRRGYNEPTNGVLASEVVAAAARSAPPPKQADAVTPRLLKVMVESASVRRLDDLPGRVAQLRRIVLLAVALGFRAFDVLAGDDASLNHKGIRFCDIHFYNVAGGRWVEFVPGLLAAEVDAMHVNLRGSKTKQAPESRFVFAAPVDSYNAVLCPVVAMLELCEQAAEWRRRTRDLICMVGAVGGGTYRPLRRLDMAALIADAARLTPGVDTGAVSKWTSHSAKVGGTTWLRAARFDEGFVNMLFRWSSSELKMVRYYGKPSIEEVQLLQIEHAEARARYWNTDVTMPRAFAA